MKSVLAIVGCGELGMQIANYALSDNHYDKIVFFDDYTLDKEQNGFPILGNIDTIELEYQNKSFDEIILALGYKHLKKKKELFERFEGKIPFGKIIHSTSWVDNSAIISTGCVIYPSCTIDAHAIIEQNTVLNLGCAIAHDTTIGKHCFLSPRVAVAGFVKVEDLCIIGINATIIDNINIAAETQIGAGSVVIKSIVEKGLYVGNPSKFIR